MVRSPLAPREDSLRPATSTELEVRDRPDLSRSESYVALSLAEREGYVPRHLNGAGIASKLPIGAMLLYSNVYFLPDFTVINGH